MNRRAEARTFLQPVPEPEKPRSVTVDGQVYRVEQVGELFRWYSVRIDPVTGNQRAEVTSRPSVGALERAIYRGAEK